MNRRIGEERAIGDHATGRLLAMSTPAARESARERTGQRRPTGRTNAGRTMAGVRARADTGARQPRRTRAHRFSAAIPGRTP